MPVRSQSAGYSSRTKRLTFLGSWCAVVTAALVAGCGGDASVPDTWVAAEEEYVVFLSWERSGDEVTGDGVGVGLGCDDSSPPNCTVQDEERFTFRGAINDDRVRLRSVAQTGVDVLVGTLADDQLVLRADGGGEPVRLRPGSQEDYEAARDALRVSTSDASDR